MDNPEEATEATAEPVSASAAIRGSLDPKVEAIVAEWWSAVNRSVGPLINVQALNALGVARDNLLDQLAATLR
jgi:hypothetical protein